MNDKFKTSHSVICLAVKDALEPLKESILRAYNESIDYDLFESGISLYDLLDCAACLAKECGFDGES